MSEVIDKAVAHLADRISGGFDAGVAKFVIGEEGSILLDSQGVRPGDGPADVTLTADAETFHAMLEGETNPTNAFMAGKLTVDGDMGLAMQLGTLLS